MKAVSILMSAALGVTASWSAMAQQMVRIDGSSTVFPIIERSPKNSRLNIGATIG